MNKLTVSIIVATKDRFEHLKELLESVALSKDSFDELIVIDSSEDKTTRKMNEETVREYEGKYFFERRKGLTKARNIGIRKSSSEIIVFLDDDFRMLKPMWISNLVRHFEDQNVGACTGRMISFGDDEISQLWEQTMSFDRGNERYIVTRNDMNLTQVLNAVTKVGEKRLREKTPAPFSVGYGFGSFRREVFYKVGFFDENLGRGTPSRGSDDTDMYYRILKKGYKIVYEPESITFHVHRQTEEDVKNAAYSAGVSVRSFMKKYLRRDYYIFVLFYGHIVHLMFSWIKASLNTDTKLRQAIAAELMGFIGVKKRI